MKYKEDKETIMPTKWTGHKKQAERKVLMLASVASMIDQFNFPNIRLLQELGYQVHVACNFQEGNTCDMRRIQELQKVLQDMQVVWHQWDCPRTVHCAGQCLAAYEQLKVLIVQNRYQWMHCHSPIGGVLARLAAHWAKTPVVYTAHGFHFYKGAPMKNWLLYYPIEKLLANWTQVIITVNREDFQLAKRKFAAEKIGYIPGIGIDLARFQKPNYIQKQERISLDRERLCRRFGIPKDAAILLSVGELNKGKNHRMVIKALADLYSMCCQNGSCNRQEAPHMQEVYYLICGQGSMQKNLQKYADALGIGTRIRMPGYQEDMPWIYQNSDVFVFPSFREGMPVALMEAMAAGMPCVVSDIRGNRELIQDIVWKEKTLKLRFSLKHPWQLTQTLAALLADRLLCQRCGRLNQKKILHYGSMDVQKRMLKIYTWMEDRGCR